MQNCGLNVETLLVIKGTSNLWLKPFVVQNVKKDFIKIWMVFLVKSEKLPYSTMHRSLEY